MAGKSQTKLEIGYKSNMLTVISEEIPGKRNPPTPVKYETICECGTVSIKKKADLISGRIQSCGCLNRKDVIGTRFNNLTVVAVNNLEPYTNPAGESKVIKYFECLCDCGNTTIVRQAALTRTKSCGCVRIENNKSRKPNLIGQKFNRLTVIKKDEQTGKWWCQCDCGGEALVKTSSLRNSNTKSCGCLQKEHASNSMSSKLRKYRESLGFDPDVPMTSDDKVERSYFIEFAKGIYKRDLHTCVRCSKSHCKLNAHHLETWAACPAKRFDSGNVVTLCEECHFEIHNGDYFTLPDPIMTILLQGYANIIEEGEIWAVRIELTPN